MDPKKTKEPRGQALRRLKEPIQKFCEDCIGTTQSMLTLKESEKKAPRKLLRNLLQINLIYTSNTCLLTQSKYKIELWFRYTPYI